MSENTLNMKDIAENVAAQEGLTKVASARIVKQVFEEIKAGLADGKSIRLDKFGTFDTRKRAARVGRNPSTGASVPVPATVAVKFRASPMLKDKVQ